MIDITKKYRTRKGDLVEILSTSGRGCWPVIGYIGGGTDLRCWMPDGSLRTEGDHYEDLIEIKEKKTLTLWLNIYDDCVGVYRSLESAKLGEISGQIQARKQITIEYEEGEWL